MTSRKMIHAEGIPRCQALTQKKTRCKNDATTMHKGCGYCSRHHELLIGKNYKLPFEKTMVKAQDKLMFQMTQFKPWPEIFK